MTDLDIFGVIGLISIFIGTIIVVIIRVPFAPTNNMNGENNV